MKILNICLFFLVGCISLASKKLTKPNVILIYMDDMGYGDASCYGALDYQTPNIDALASKGMRFTNFLVAQAVCSASRAALLTGCYPNRIGISGALMPYHNFGINENENTLAEAFKSVGYKTGMVGKWHLGHHKKFLPLQHGFDSYFGIPYSNDMWPVEYDGRTITDTANFKKKNYPPLPLIENNETLRTINDFSGQDEITTLYTEKALNFINKNNSNPFFLYLAHSMPHVPLGVSSKFKGKSKQGPYGDVMMEIDWSLGQITQTLKKLGLEKNTIIIFTSDNGPWANYGAYSGSTGGLREGKGTAFEGGVRVPFIIKWPGSVPEGTVSNALAANIDVYATLSNIIGAETKLTDGLDFTNLFTGKTKTGPRKEFYYYYASNELRAVRRDNWKLVFEHTNPQSYEGVLPGKDRFPGSYNKSAVQQALYDLRRDPGEEYDVQSMHPEIVSELESLAEKARLDLGDKLKNRTGQNVRKAGFL